MTRPYYEGDGVTLYHGDALDVLRAMPGASVAAVISDPPYGTGQWQRPAAGAGRDPRAAHGRETWDEWRPEWIAEALRVSSGPVLTFAPSARVLDVLSQARAIGAQARLLVWCKPDPMPGFRQTAWGTEHVVALRSDGLKGGKDWHLASSPRPNRNADATGHPHQKPESVMRWLVSVATRAGDTVLDPFAGSGTTGVAAVLEGRRFIGVEQDAEWARVSRERLVAAVSQGTLALDGAA